MKGWAWYPVRPGLPLEPSSASSQPLWLLSHPLLPGVSRGRRMWSQDFREE